MTESAFDETKQIESEASCKRKRKPPHGIRFPHFCLWSRPVEFQARWEVEVFPSFSLGKEQSGKFWRLGLTKSRASPSCSSPHPYSQPSLLPQSNKAFYRVEFADKLIRSGPLLGREIRLGVEWGKTGAQEGRFFSEYTTFMLFEL